MTRENTIEKHNPLTRREVLKLTVFVLAGGAALVTQKWLTTTTEGLAEDLPEPNIRTINPESVINSILEDHKVSIPTQVDELYGWEQIYMAATGYAVAEVIPNAPLTFAEAEIIRDTLDLVPGTSNVVSLILPYRREGSNVIPGGGFWGSQWPFYTKRSKYKDMPEEPLSEQRAMNLVLPYVGIEEALPGLEADMQYYLPSLFLQKTMPDTSNSVQDYTQIPWTTHGEALRRTIIHEIGHGIISRVRERASKTRAEYWERAGKVQYGGASIDTNNPLFELFADVSGWVKIPYPDFVEQFGTEKAIAEAELLRSNSDAAQRLIWARDQNVWGDLENRVPRITPVASFGPIQEAFCEFWMASVLYPKLLTTDEREFFNKLRTGLSGDFAKMVEELVNNSQTHTPLRNFPQHHLVYRHSLTS